MTEMEKEVMREVNSVKYSQEAKQTEEKNWLLDVIENAKDQAARNMDFVKADVLKVTFYL